MHLGSDAKPSTKHEVLLSMLAIGFLAKFLNARGSNEAPVSRPKSDRSNPIRFNRSRETGSQITRPS